MREGPVTLFLGLAFWAGLIYGGWRAWDWGSARYERHQCEAAIESHIRPMTTPEADFHVERCALHVASTGDPDVCFTTSLKDGQRVTKPIRLDCAAYVRERHH